MAITTTAEITNIQEKVIGALRLTLKDDVLAIKNGFSIERGVPAWTTRTTRPSSLA